jgi:hypothetical protein
VNDQKKRTLKVGVYLTVTVDRDAYLLNYGTDDAKEIRDAIKYGTASAVSEGQVLHDSILNVEVK